MKPDDYLKEELKDPEFKEGFIEQKLLIDAYDLFKLVMDENYKKDKTMVISQWDERVEFWIKQFEKLNGFE